MAVSYSADEILEMAEEIERRGVKFYTQAAKRADDDKVREMLTELAGMEEKHRATFAQMRKKWSDHQSDMEIYDPESEMLSYLQQIAVAHGWEGKASADKELTGNESIPELLNIAIRAERGSIDFYLGLKQSVQSEQAREQVESIIREEMSHVATLNDYLRQLSE